MNNIPLVTKAMILAAGLGSRFRPWTDQHPKALAPVNGKSLLQRNIEYLQRHGICDIVVNVHHFAPQIVEALRSNKGWGSRITISDETERVLETGGGLKKARPFLDGAPFILMNVDILTDMDLSGMIDSHRQYRPLATLAITDRVTSRNFLFDGRQELCGWKNTATGEERIVRTADAGGMQPKAFSGIHIIEPAIFYLIRREGKFSMVDLYLDLAASETIRGFDHSGSRLIDVGRPESADLAAQWFA
jgi:MurNAc alpha-1-phosphate uridylyltransferase